MNEIAQWQLSPGKIFYQFENAYYGIATWLLQQNIFCCANKVLWHLKPEYHKVTWPESSCRPVGEQLGTDRQLIGDRLANVTWTHVYKNKKVYDCISSQRGFTCSKQGLIATNSSLRPSCDSCYLSATSRRPPCDPPATSRRPPEIMVARGSPIGCKLCVTGA